jgi:hypothetical protein
MKTMKNVFGLKGISTMMIAFILILASCKKDESVLSSTDTQNVNSESVTDSYNDEGQDMSSIAVSNVKPSQFAGRVGGRTEGNGLVDPVVAWQNLDDRLKCAEITINTTNAAGAKPTGTITIDFDKNTSCVDSRGIARKGKIVIEYSGYLFLTGSFIKTTFNGYFRNDVKVDGVHTLTNITAGVQDFPKFTVSITGGKITFADGKTITRTQNFIREWRRATNPAQDTWAILTGSEASGANRNGKTYTMNVTADLVYSRACAISNKVFIPVSGTKVFVVEGKTYSVDFGTGNCDNDVTVSVNGASKTITVGADGN